MFATAAVERIRTPPRFPASLMSGVALVATIAALSILADNLALAVYALSFWHYYLYWLAYRFGAVALPVFKRDAVMMKSVSLAMCGTVYLQSGWNVPSLFFLGCGFLLNASAAKALGADRTYYGHELMDLPFHRIKQFPYSYLSHPMLLGNITAYGGMLLSPGFRGSWWPLACAHVALNLCLLLMELLVEPRRLGARRQFHGRPWGTRRRRRHQDISYSILCGAIGAVLGLWTMGTAGTMLGASCAACASLYAFVIYRCYGESTFDTAAGNQGKDVE